MNTMILEAGHKIASITLSDGLIQISATDSERLIVQNIWGATFAIKEAADFCDFHGKFIRSIAHLADGYIIWTEDDLYFRIFTAEDERVPLTKQTINEISERLPGALAIAANALGLTVAELQQALERKEIRADDFLPLFKAAVAKPVVQGEG